jgi:hypothetical protein
LEKDTAYRRDFEPVQEEVAGKLLDEAVEVALNGWLEPVFYRGQQCGTIRRYSDRLLIMLLRAGRR